jgi:uncharacterized protein
MPTTDPDRVVDVLDEAECRRLLASAPIGRVAYTRDALPAIQPVIFRVHEDHVLFPAHPDGDLMAGIRGAVVAFEVDAYDDRALTGWSVTVLGPSRPVTDPVESARYGTLGWPQPAPERCYVAISMTVLRGWRTVAAARPVEPLASA